MPEYDYIPDHPEQAGTELAYAQFRSADRMQALLRAGGAGVQMMEDLLMDLQLSGTLDASTGDAQDGWGDLVGLSRMGLSSERYSGFIAAQAIANSSENRGQHDFLVAMGLAMGADEVRTWTMGHSGDVLIEITSYAGFSESELRAARRIFVSGRQGGVGPEDYGLVVAVDHAFGFDDNPGFDDGVWADTF